MGVVDQRGGTRTARAAGGVAASIFQYALQVGLQAVLMPVVLRRAGQDALGVYAVVIQCVGYLTLTDLGFSSAVGRYLAQASGAADGGARFSRVVATARLFSMGSNALFFVLCGALAWSLPVVVSAPPSLISQGRWALALLAGWSLLRTPLAVSAAVLTATQHLARANLAAAAGNAFRILASLALVLAGGGLFGLLLGHLLGEVMTLSVQYAMCRVIGAIPKRVAAPYDRALVSEMLGFGLRAFGISVGVRLIFQTDAIVVGHLFGSAAASVYYSTQIPATILYNVPLRISDNAAPAVNELWGRGAIESVRRAYLRLLRYTLLVAAVFGVGVIALNGALVRVWLGPAQFAGTSMSVALGLFTVLLNTSHVGFVVVMASGRIGTLGGLVLAEGIANLALSILLGRAMGLPGVMWATVVTNLVSSGYLFVRAQRVLELRWRDTFAALKGLVLPIGAGVTLAIMLNAGASVTSWSGLLAAGAALVTVYGTLAWRQAVTPEERSWVRARLARIAGTSGASA